jgi:predicted DNA-binding protein
MATTVRLEPATEQRLDQLTRLSGRTKAFTLRQQIEIGLDDVVSELGLEPLCIADQSNRSLQPF